MAERLLGPYRLVELKASGPSCDVWTAWDTQLNRRVEVRLLPRLARTAQSGEVLFKAFVDEVQRWSQLRHVAVQIPIDQAPLHADEAWYVTEVVEGAIPVRRLIDASQRLPWTHAAMIVHEIAATLSLVHQRGLVHGHLRPAAVLLQLRGRVLLAEIGLSLQVLVRTGVAAFEGIGSVADQRIYLSPEALAMKEQDARSDVFSLGVLAFEMLTGQLPFATEADVRALTRPGAAVPDPGRVVGHLPPGLRALVQDMLAPQPSQRPESMSVVLEQLRYLLARDGLSDVREALRDAFRRQAHLFSDDPLAAAGARPLLSDDGPEAERAAAPVDKPSLKRQTARMGAPRKQLEGTRGATATLAGPPRAAPPARDGGSEAERPARSVRRNTESMVAPAPRPSPIKDILADAKAAPTRPERASPERAAWVLVALLLAGLGGAGWAVLREPPRAADLPAAPAPQRTALVDREPGGHARFAGEREGDPTPAPPRPDDPAEAALDKARAAMKLGQWNLAEAHARDALALRDGLDPELHGVLAEALERQGRVDDAVASWLALDAQDLRATRGHEQAGRLLAEAGRHDEALVPLKEAFARGAESAELLRRLAVSHLARGEEREAEAALTRATALGEDDPEALVALATLLERRGDRAGARPLYEAALAQAPDLETARAGLARVATAEGRPAEALALLDGAPGGEAGTLLAQADAAFRAGRFSQAADLFGEVARMDGQATATVLRNWAVALERAGRSREAIAAYQAAAAASPGDAEVQFLLGRLLARAGQRQAAIAALERAAAASPGWEPPFELGLLAVEAGDWRGAARAFQATLARHPDHLPSLQNLGRAQVELGEAAAAVDTFRRVARLTSDDPAPLLTAAALLQRMQRIDEMNAALAEACRRGASQACTPP